MRFLITFFIFILFLFFSLPAYALEANNKFGMHIANINSTDVLETAKLVNSNGGDWGYVTFVIQSDDRNQKKWQEFFNELRRSHLIPIVRIATKIDGKNWEVPRESDAKEWADFLDSLIWPVDIRYVIVYNETNTAKEWGGRVDPISYARILNSTIDELNAKTNDFFILNAGFDASAPHKKPNYEDEERYVREMNFSVPGIFEKLDGWSSHSYPNPDFSGNPNDKGRGTIETYKWELNLLKNLGVKKNLPVFITETGWKRGFLTEKMIADYYKIAFEQKWTDEKIIAITPFVLDYTFPPFDLFSFKIPDAEKDTDKILGKRFPDYFAQYETLYNLPKVKGAPSQRHQASLLEGPIPRMLRPRENYYTQFSFRNDGLTVWGEKDDLLVKAEIEGVKTSVQFLNKHQQIEPGELYDFYIKLNPNSPGLHHGKLYLEDTKGFIAGSFQEIDFEAVERLEQIKRQSNSLFLEVYTNLQMLIDKLLY